MLPIIMFIYKTCLPRIRKKFEKKTRILAFSKNVVFYCCSCYLMLLQEPVFSVQVSVNKSVFAGRAMYCNVAM